MKIPRSAIHQVVESCLEIPDIHIAIKYLSPDLTVRACRQFKASKRDTRTTIVLSIGEPNYSETEFIKKCQKAGEPFPIKKIQFKWYPKKKK